MLTVFELVGAVSGAVSAIAAVKSVTAAHRTIAEANRNLDAEREATYFRQTVFDPIWSGLGHFRSAVKGGCEALVERVSKLYAGDGSIAEGDAAIRECLECVDTAFYEMKLGLHFDRTTCKSVAAALETLHDATSTRIAAFPLSCSPSDATAWLFQVLAHTGMEIDSVIRSARAEDPTRRAVRRRKSGVS